MNTNRSRVRFRQSDDEPQQDALSRAAASQDCQGLAALHLQADPVQNLLAAERLMQALDGDDRGAAVLLGLGLLDRDLRRNLIDAVDLYFGSHVVVFPSPRKPKRSSREKYDDEFHEHDIGQDHEQ